METFETPSEQFIVRFTGELNTVNANTFTTSVMGHAAAVHGINAILYPGSKIEVRISAPREGSFEFTIHLLHAAKIAAATVALFGSDGANAVSNVIEVLVDSLSLLKHLKGEKPRRIEQGDRGVVVENVRGDVTVVNEQTIQVFYNNKTVPEALSSTFKALEDEPAIDGFDIERRALGAPKELFHADREDFDDLARSADAVRPDTQVKSVEGKIYPVKFVTEPGQQWNGYYNGNKIRFTISDEQFFSDIQRRRFGHGDSMDVTLEIYQELDTEIGIYINKSYSVLKVHEYHERPPGAQAIMFP